MSESNVLLFRRVLRLYSHPLVVIIFVILGTLILFDPVPFQKLKLFPPAFGERGPQFLGLTFIVFALFLMLFNYLEGRGDEHRRSGFTSYGSSGSYASEEQNYRSIRETERINELLLEQHNTVQNELRSIRDVVEKGATSQVVELSAAEKLKLLDDISKSIETTLSESFLKAVDRKYSEEGVRVAERRFLLEDVDLVRRRLTAEIDALRRRASANLAIGSITTVLAMASLAYIVLAREVMFDSSAHVLSHYVPRISFVVFIEVFAYFFLRLYKANLSDIKFYQNELTTMESKALALRSALLEGKPEALTLILKQLSTTERNFILKKGETTVELELERIEAARALDVVKRLRGVIGSVRSSKGK